MRKMAKDLESDHGRKKIFKVARCMVGEGKDYKGARSMRSGDVVVIDKETIKKVWKEYMSRLLNEENEWDKDTEWAVKGGEREVTEKKEVELALRRMKDGKAAGNSEVVVEMLKAAEQVGV